MICNNCGNEIDDNDKFCKYCGMNTEFSNIDIPLNTKNENKKATILSVISAILFFGGARIITLLYNLFAPNLNNNNLQKYFILVLLLIGIILLIYVRTNYPEHKRK